MTVVTRFAPSPTGYLHIGGARTALFNWLYARHMGGKFLLRIEDTDKARNTPEAVQAIHEGLAWLGLHPDEPTVLQSQRVDRHREVAMALYENGFAYWDKEDDRGSGPPLRFTGPRANSITIQDLVQGPVTVQTENLDDMVLLRSDGTPTYMLAVVVDDHDMGVTHVIRGDDHLNNAFRQLPIYWAMGWDEPKYAHIPLIHDEDGKKLSKRTGAAAVEDYREMGILLEAMLNYLVRLGWSHGNDEYFHVQDMIKWFDIQDVNRNAAQLDKKKLASVNGHWIRRVADGRLAWEAGRILEDRGVVYDEHTLSRAIPALRERSSDLNALPDGTMFLWDRDLLDKAEPLSEQDVRVVERVLRDFTSDSWNHDGIMLVLNGVAEAQGLKLGKVVAPLRMTLTGSKISPPITDTMLLLGLQETQDRLRIGLEKNR